MNLEREYEFIYAEAKRKWQILRDKKEGYLLEDAKGYLILMKETLDSLAELEEESWKHDE